MTGDHPAWTAVPGIAMSTACAGWRSRTIDLGDATGVQVVFNNGTGTWATTGERTTLSAPVT